MEANGCEGRQRRLELGGVVEVGLVPGHGMNWSCAAAAIAIWIFGVAQIYAAAGFVIQKPVSKTP